MGVVGDWPVAAADRLAIWNRALFDELFPIMDEPFTPVLLACDDEVLRVVAARLGRDSGQAGADFASDVKLTYEVGLRNGFSWTFRGWDERAPNPRPMPPFFALLCLWVLAASRMGSSDGKYPTKEYYGRLNGLIDVRGDDQLENFTFIPTAFQRFASWLEDDLAGSRGRLIVPESPYPAYVGFAVAQTVFRRRDRDLLSSFFSERLRGSLGQVDPLPWLQRWSGRNRLTRHAQEMLADVEMADRVRAAIRSAFNTWDGSELVEVEGGQRGHVWPGGLRQRLGPPRLFLYAGNTLPIEFALEGATFTLEPAGEVELPWAMLGDLANKEVRLGDATATAGAIKLRSLDELALFELTEIGLQMVRQPTRDEVWVLTCSSSLRTRLERWRVHDRGALPTGWGIYRDVQLSELPQVERAAVAAEQEPIRVSGGLRLGDGAFLTGGPPLLLAGDLEIDQLPVTVNGEFAGHLQSGGRLALPDGQPGLYGVAVGDGDWWGEYELAGEGARRDYGALRYRLDGPNSLRAGATADASGGALTVCGAQLSAPFDGVLPLFARGSHVYIAIRGDGTLSEHRAPAHPAWLTKVGLSSGSRWEIDPSGVAWLVRHSRLGRPAVYAVAPALVSTLIPEAAALVDELGSKAVIVEADDEAWKSLLELARSATPMNQYDRLLEWASERGAGSWQQWREACDYLALEPTGAARSLSALGHVELDWARNRFAVAPPTAVLTFRSSGCVIVTGARPRGLWESLEALHKDKDSELDIDLRDPVSQQRGPETWLVEAEMADVQEFCDLAGLAFELDSGRRIARALPAASLALVGEPERPSDRFDRAWFDPKLCTPNANKDPRAEGLWLVKEERREVAFIRRAGEWYRIPTREYGPYVAYPDSSFISYRAGAESLIVDRAAPLPPLLARALTLQSGRMPLFESSSKRTYVNVDDELATLVQEKLDTPIKWER